MTKYDMESLKEFNYYDPKTGEKIDKPSFNLQYDKKDGRLYWYDAGNSPAKRNPGWKVEATSDKERAYLNKTIASGKGVRKDQVFTPNWQKQTRERVAAEAAKKAAKPPQEIDKPSQKTAGQDNTQRYKSSPPRKSDEIVIVENLVNSGALQEEITKAIVNAKSIPILADDLPKISAAIFRALKSARKTKLFNIEFLVGEGEVINAGKTRATSADAIADTIVKNYLIKTKAGTGGDFYTYTPLPEEEPLQEKGEASKKKSSASGKKRSASNSTVKATAPAATATANSTKTASKDSTNPTPESLTKPSSEDPKSAPEGSATLPPENTSVQRKQIVLVDSSIEPLRTLIKNKAAEMLEDTFKSFESTATSARFRCVGEGKPLQTKPEKPEETPAPQSEEAAQKNEETVQKTEETVRSSDYRVFTRLVEVEKGEEATATENAETEEQTNSTVDNKGTAKETTTEETTEKTAEKAAEEEKKPAATKAEAPTFPTTEALKTFMTGLNKAGSPFETDLAVYTLSYKLEDVDTSSLSFNILVESKETTPKEGFWKSFGKKLKSYLKQAGAQIVSYLAGERGHMDI